MAYPVHANIITTVFWVGEEAGADNGFIPNYESTWDGEWLRHFGGIDDPGYRDGANPLLFAPRENPFYFALAYNDFDDNGVRKPDAGAIVPWANEKVWGADESMVKNRWIKITANGKTAYAQWEDAGPFGEDDSAYVFGNAPPANGILTAAGLDVSPAVRTLLGLGDVGRTAWQFVDFADVPAGPWKRTVTTSQVDFDAVKEKPSARGDWLIGSVKANSIHALAGDDTVFGSAGKDRIWGEGGDDSLHGGTGKDTIKGGDGADVIVGESGSDSLTGGASADQLFGGTGQDTISGGSGNDTITGGAGRDKLSGGSGRDVFAWRDASESTVAARDRITDFRQGIDSLDFSPLDVAGGGAFSFKGAGPYEGDAGEIRIRVSNKPGTADDNTFVYADLDGDRRSDVKIEIDGIVHLTAADFIL